MFFRVWFLFVCKLGYFALLAWIATFVFQHQSWAEYIHVYSAMIFIPLCIIGAVVGIWMGFNSFRMNCPLCGKKSQFLFTASRQPGVHCKDCGVVSARNWLWSFKIVRESSISSS